MRIHYVFHLLTVFDVGVRPLPILGAGGFDNATDDTADDIKDPINIRILDPVSG